MQNILSLPLAAAEAFPWMNVVWAILGITVFMFAAAAFGRWSSVAPRGRGPHLPTPSGPTDAAGAANEIAPEVAAAIAAAVHVVLGASAQVTSATLQPDAAVDIGNHTLIWSIEGRRQIYTSHKVR